MHQNIHNPQKTQQIIVVLAVCGCISVCFGANSKDSKFNISKFSSKENCEYTAIKDAKKIRKLLETAVYHSSNGRCFSPVGTSAEDAYRMILELFPGHVGALEGLQELRKNPSCKPNVRLPTNGIALTNKIQDVTKIEQLLDLAALHSSIGRYTQPPKNNALETYGAILELDPDNIEARQGIRKLVSKLEREAKARLKDSQHDAAFGLIKEGFVISPNHKGLLELKARICREKPALHGCVYDTK